MPVCKIAILENYALFSSGFKSLLDANSEFEVILEGKNPESLFKGLKGERPHIILIDMLHCRHAGIGIIKQTCSYFPDVPILLITSYEYSDCFTDYLQSGVKGFIFPNDSPDVLVSAVKNIFQGKTHFNGNFRFPDEDSSSKSKCRSRRKDEILTRREQDVLKLFSDGLTYKEVGVKLFISPRTVESHKINIMSKLNINSTAEMIKYATRNVIITN